MESIESLFIEETGQENAESIIFLHASGSSSHMWRNHVSILEQDFHCILLDLPGHGNSRHAEWTNFDDVAEMLAAIIKKKAHGKSHLVGLSLGGSLILKLLEKHAEMIDRIIVDGAAHRPITGYRKIIAAVYIMSAFKNTNLVARLMSKMIQKDGVSEEECQIFISDLQKTSKKSFRCAMSQANLLRVSLIFDNPAFFVSGGKEDETIHESHRFLAGKKANSEAAYYPDKGHAWLFSDVNTHIQLVKYFLKGDDFPDRLKGY